MDFSQLIIQWYDRNKRDMPWRQTREPYLIWVSEIILQQTRVEQGLAYYHKFTTAFPDVKSLAEASEQAVLSIWKGLGYYSRARNMHHTAQKVMQHYGGKFPVTYLELLTLKGIGPYTAAAIASICNHEPIPVVDGNVIRVFSRIFGYKEPVGSTAGYKKIFKKSTSFIEHSHPGTYNQAVMEFGALHCKPRQPLCNQCIFQKNCFAFAHNMVDSLPQPAKAIVKKERFFHYFLIIHPQKGLLMQKREAGDIWQNLWELPLVESEKFMDAAKATEKSGLFAQQGIDLQSAYTDINHILTHQVIKSRFFYLSHEALLTPIPPSMQWQDVSLLKTLPIPRLIDKYLKIMSHQISVLH
ncbi:MAG: A/G-specific adenine glycosylase [Lentimicrobiaceae bacterium]|nr:A/G-specific adenine glycosylase [Lentimicrobiaceae bacterium]